MVIKAAGIVRQKGQMPHPPPNKRAPSMSDKTYFLNHFVKDKRNENCNYKQTVTANNFGSNFLQVKIREDNVPVIALKYTKKTLA